MGGYVRVSKIFGTLIGVMLKIWAYSGIVLFVCFILYYLYGGICAFILLIFAATGVCYNVIYNIY